MSATSPESAPYRSLAPGEINQRAPPWVTGLFVRRASAKVVCQAPPAKIFCFSEYPNHFYVRRRPVPLEGRFAIVTSAGRDAVDANRVADESTSCGRRSRVVLTPRRWYQVCGVIRKRRWQNSPAHRGEYV